MFVFFFWGGMPATPAHATPKRRRRRLLRLELRVGRLDGQDLLPREACHGADERALRLVPVGILGAEELDHGVFEPVVGGRVGRGPNERDPVYGRSHHRLVGVDDGSLR